MAAAFFRGWDTRTVAVSLRRPGRVDSLVRTSSRRDGAFSGGAAIWWTKTRYVRVLREKGLKGLEGLLSNLRVSGSEYGSDATNISPLATRNATHG